SRLNQLRLRRGSGSGAVSDADAKALHQQGALIYGGSEAAGIDRGITFTVDVEGGATGGLIGYRARKHAPVIDIDKVGGYPIEEFWTPVHGQPGGLILTPDDFYILASREHVTIPADHAAEMLAYDVQAGEFRVHYAGFFDPGFGDPLSGSQPTRAVLEVRSHEVPFLIDADQIVGRLIYEKLTERPEETYGSKIGSHYQGQGLTLGKHFVRPQA
ncbi:MAG: 2'-deoxycytidine 5'-triphosphate deaminase, partial [Pseudomonadota bacterium]